MILRVLKKLAWQKTFYFWRLAHRRRQTWLHFTLYLSGDARCRLPDIIFGSRCILERQVTIWLPRLSDSKAKLILGEDVFVGQNTHFAIFGEIQVGSFTMIGANCYIVSTAHRFDRRDVPMQKQGFSGGPIRIGEDVWLGTHVVILPDVIIGRGAIVAAGSVVTCNIPPYEIWGGVPAKFLKLRPGGTMSASATSAGADHAGDDWAGAEVISVGTSKTSLQSRQENGLPASIGLAR